LLFAFAYLSNKRKTQAWCSESDHWCR